MRIRLLQDVSAYWNYALSEYKRGEELIGDLARHLADNAPPDSVEVIDAAPESQTVETPAGGQSGPDGGASREDTEVGDVPPTEGTIEDLMTWVGDDAGRAALALQAEQAKEKPRSTVVKRLGALTE